MALSPDDKFLFLNADTTAGESDASMYYPIRYLRGLDCPSDGAVSFYFRGPNDTTSTRIIVSTTAGFVKELFLQFVNEINFGEKAVIMLASKNTSVTATDGGSDFVYVNATVGAIIQNDDNTGFENLQVAENLNVGGTTTSSSLILTNELIVQYGGTGASSLTDNGVLFGNGAAAISAVDLSANGNVIVGGATPAVVTGANLAGAGLAATVGDGTLVLAVETLNQDTTGSAATLTTPRAINGVDFDGSAAITVTAAGSTLSDTVTVAKGGTGATSLTADGVLFGNGTSAVSAVDLSTNGNIVVGGSTPAVVTGANLAGSGLAATVGNGTLVLAVETLNQDTTGNADTATLAADATTLATPRAIFGHNFDGSAALTGVIASANLDADTAHLSGAQSFTGAKTFSAGIIPSFVKHSISGNATADYGPGAEILFGISAETTTAGAIYVLRSGTWTLMDADFPNRCRQLAAVAVGTDSAVDGMLIRGCVTLASAYTAGTDAEGIRVFASTTAGEATLTAPSASGDTVRILGYSLNAGDKKMFFNPDNSHVEIA